MRTLYFCRHAKSSWAHPGMADFDRPLNDRGLRNAPMMARKFKERRERVYLIVSSPAVRAFTTAKFFTTELNIHDQLFRTDPRIYEASTRTLLQVVNELPIEAASVMLFGHNPGFSEIVAELTGSFAGELPTCAIARIDLPIEKWEFASRSSGSLIWLDYPKRYEV